MKRLKEHVDIKAPLPKVYNQWTQFEEFPKILDSIEAVTQRTDTNTTWTFTIAGVTKTFDAEITEQHPDERVAWQTTQGPKHRGLVTFHCVDDTTTRVHVHIDYEPDTIPEKAAAALGPIGHRIKTELDNFKRFIEHAPQETGGWRGNVPRPVQHNESTDAGVADRGGTSDRSIPPGGLR